MKNQLRIFFVVFFLLSQTGNAQGIDGVDDNNLVQEVMIPVVISAVGQLILYTLPERMKLWKMPLQVGLAFVVTQFIPLTGSSLTIQENK